MLSDEVLQTSETKKHLLNTIIKGRDQLVGHILSRDSLTKTIIEGGIYEKQPIGKPS